MSLLSAAEIAAIQTVAQSGMTSTCAILSQEIIETPDGQQTVWATSSLDVPCWIKQIGRDSATLQTIGGGIAIPQLVNIRVPVGTVVASGDHIAIEGVIYTAQAGNQSDTYPAWWEIAARVLE